jgi:hypothetical protein
MEKYPKTKLSSGLSIFKNVSVPLLTINLVTIKVSNKD